MSDTSVTWGPICNGTVSRGHAKTFIDKGIQCKLDDPSSYEPSEIIKVSSNDRYNTNNGSFHLPFRLNTSTCPAKRRDNVFLNFFL